MHTPNWITIRQHELHHVCYPNGETEFLFWTNSEPLHGICKIPYQTDSEEFIDIPFRTVPNFESQFRRPLPHTLFDKISLDVDAVLCHDQDTCKTVHTCTRCKMPHYNIVNIVWLFSHDWFQGNSMCIDRRQSIWLCSWITSWWSKL